MVPPRCDCMPLPNVSTPTCATALIRQSCAPAQAPDSRHRTPRYNSLPLHNSPCLLPTLANNINTAPGPLMQSSVSADLNPFEAILREATRRVAPVSAAGTPAQHIGCAVRRPSAQVWPISCISLPAEIFWILFLFRGRKNRIPLLPAAAV